jgi:23S rRNA (cytosine1962-C5)-methyltransferase
LNSCKETLDDWECSANGLRLRLRPTPTGQVGVFPEHWRQWDWMFGCMDRIRDFVSLPRVLHLFAYTGGTTLALAKHNCAVTHVDASKPTVAWARENCARNQLEAAPIRWVVEEATRYVEREIKRGNQYEAIILDPPTFGHGTHRERWEIRRDLPRLLVGCWRLLSNHRSFVLLCGHSYGIDLRSLLEGIEEEFGVEAMGKVRIQQAYLNDEKERVLDCGYACRVEFESL